MRLAGSLSLTGVLACALWLVGPVAARPAGCTEGLTKVKGVQARVFCGPAAATVKIGGKTLTFTGGSCDRSTQYVAVNIGTVVLGVASSKPDYFGLDVGRILGDGPVAAKDGTYEGSALALDHGGKGYAVRADTLSVTLSGNRTKGTFRGSLLLGGDVSGMFTC